MLKMVGYDKWWKKSQSYKIHGGLWQIIFLNVENLKKIKSVDKFLHISIQFSIMFWLLVDNIPQWFEA